MRPQTPISSPLVAWGNAWLTGHVGLDEAADQVEKLSGPVVVDSLPLRGYLAELRVNGLTELRLALPAPGDPLGLSGPPAFNAAAVEAGEAAIAVLRDRVIGLVPAQDLRGSSYVGVRLAVHESGPPRADLPSLAEAERELTGAMLEATEALADVQGPLQGHPGQLRAGGELAPGYPARAHRVSALAARLSAALRMADDRGLTSAQIATRAVALRSLDAAIRRALISAHHAVFEPPHV
ncbi:hypothetical protein AB0B45_12180 [Nonomuraea sp. NPDC049152]|uniref:hypothetical protein n=1 Tax=Nonomuraea sp. NPDC049152 TaxID=3154350 RepID=UPI0034082DDD